jgi:hypothetical protein
MVSRPLVGAFSLVLLAACSTSTPTPTGPVGGAVDGGVDTHCGTTVVNISQAKCQTPLPKDDAGADDAGAGSDYGETMYGQAGADDDCKYDVSWTSTPVYRDTDVTFTVTVKTRADGKPVLGAEPDSDVFLDATHAAPNAGTKTTETGNGVYTVGPIRFDRAGKWTVRFHFFDVCIDWPDSPHGHAAFYVNVN